MCNVLLKDTRSSAIAEGPRDASFSAVGSVIMATVQKLLVQVMKLEGYSGAMCNKHMHSTMTRSSRFHCPIDVINKPTTDELWISPVYRRLAVAKFEAMNGGAKCIIWGGFGWLGGTQVMDNATIR